MNVPSLEKAVLKLTSLRDLLEVAHADGVVRYTEKMITELILRTLPERWRF